MSDIATLKDHFVEGGDGQVISIPLMDADGAAIDTGAITAITATLRSTDTGAAIFTAANVFPGGSSRGSYPVAGTLRVTFTAADMVSEGTRTIQSRELTVVITHSGGLLLPVAVRFKMRALADVPV